MSTVAEVGAATLVALEARVTVMPPLGAGPFNVTVPVTGVPPKTEVGLTVTEFRPGGDITRTTSFDTVPHVAVIVTLVGDVTANVGTWIVTDGLPPCTVMLEGRSIMFDTDSASATDTPPVNALPLSVIVKAVSVPASTGFGVALTDSRVSGVIVKSALCELAPTVAVIVAVISEVTNKVVIVNVADVLPSGIVTVAGTLASVAPSVSAVRVTINPPAGASSSSVTVPVESVPPLTDVGLSVRLVMVGGTVMINSSSNSLSSDTG